MTDRIKQIMDAKGLQASSFADAIQVSRGTMSHILNGRNQPSKETIDKILKTFTDISSSWFLRGEGKMYKYERGFVQTGLFIEKKPVDLPDDSQVNEYPLKIEVKKPEKKPDTAAIQEINPPVVNTKKIDRIMIFYNDKTFMTFIPED